MVSISPFRGLLYGDGLRSAAVLAPPYDVIDAARQEDLLARHPHNVVRLILPLPGESADWHARAAQALADWRARGILRRDEAPALYAYRQRFTLDGATYERTGHLARVRLAPWGEGIHRHEHTRVGPRADRLRLMRATVANLSPVFGMYQDPAGAVARRLLAAAGEPLLDAEVDGVRETLWRVSDPATLAEVAGAMEARDVVIADGHHRYETALAYRDERRAAEGVPPGEERPYDYVLMYLTAAEDPGLVVLPTHRVVACVEGFDAAALLKRLGATFAVAPVPDGETLTHAARGAAVAGETVALGVCLAGGGRYVLTLRDLATAHAAASEDGPLATLDVSVLQNLALAPHLGIDRGLLATGEHVTYTISEAEACAAVAEGRAQAAFILNPTTVPQILSAAMAGVTMPQKSTYFYPKLLTGLVINPLSDD